ncbi:MAG: hypothetical protein NTV23_12755 [Propionibacteriales bacterium]|nr:hypothetical protein [Propionibacteriales bacterium]
MTETTSMPPAPDGAAEIARAAFSRWQSNDQEGALGGLRDALAQGHDWAAVLLVWMLMQRGIPGFEEAVPYAQQASASGRPWAAAHLFNNMIGNVPNAPQLLEPAMSLLDHSAPFWTGFDPGGQAWNLLANGQVDAAVVMLNARSPYPPMPADLRLIVDQARRQSDGLNQLAARTHELVAAFDADAARGQELITRTLEDLVTKAQQAGLLVTDVNLKSVNALFDADAKRNEGESKIAYRAGLGVLCVAALVAVTPLFLHYLGKGADYSQSALLAAHAGSTAALAAVAGVLLARARGRDRARQRAQDLSTAMGTMIAYSGQIVNEEERQRFMLTMGQLVLHAHLQGERGSAEDPMTGLAALLTAVRGPAAPA